MIVIGVPSGYDWLHYRGAVLVFISGQNPYEYFYNGHHGFISPIWGLIPLVPYAFLPHWIGATLISLSTIGAFSFTAQKNGCTTIGDNFNFIISSISAFTKKFKF
jgi:hypothetical protein